MQNHVDIMGRPISVGDEVVASIGNTSIHRFQVVKLCATQIKLAWLMKDEHGRIEVSNSTVLRYPEDICKVS
jgi:hypothetical protein